MGDAPRADGTVPAKVRRDRIRAIVGEGEFTRVADLAEMLGTSEVTVRADLDALAARGQLQRVRGGAVPRLQPRPELPFEQAVGAAAEEKQRIGETCAALVRDGETILLDVGTTTTAIARALVARSELRDVTVFTNGLTIALELEPAIPRFSVVVIGGTLRPLQHSLVDPLGGLALARLTVDTVFLGCNGISPAAGVTNMNLPEAEMKGRMLRASRRRVVAADGSKIGQVALAALCDLRDVDLLVTGASADAETLREIGEAGVEVRVA